MNNTIILGNISGLKIAAGAAAFEKHTKTECSAAEAAAKDTWVSSKFYIMAAFDWIHRPENYYPRSLFY